MSARSGAVDWQSYLFGGKRPPAQLTESITKHMRVTPRMLHTIEYCHFTGCIVSMAAVIYSLRVCTSEPA